MKNKTEVITMYNQKGGIGKTTTTVNVAEVLGRDFGKKVLVIDNDGQNSLSFYVNLPIDDGGRVEYEDGIYTLGYLEQMIQIYGKTPDLEDIRNSIITPTYRKNEKIANQFGHEEKTYPFHFDIIPGIGRDLNLAELIYTDSDDNWISRQENRKYSKLILKFIITQIVKYFDYDYIIIDTTPGLGIHTSNALLASDSLIIPTSTDAASTEGIKSVINTVEELELYVPNFNIRGILFNSYYNCKFDNERVADVEEYAKEYGIKVFQTKIPRNQSLRELSIEEEIAVQKRGKKYDNYNKAIYSLAEEIIQQDERGE